jgi:hypothetical protein
MGTLIKARSPVTAEQIIKKYNNWDFIELKLADFKEMAKVVGECAGIDNEGDFFKFLKRGVIIIHAPHGGVDYHPFEFIGSDTLRLSIAVLEPLSGEPQVLFKQDYISTKEGVTKWGGNTQFNRVLFDTHMSLLQRLGKPALKQLIEDAGIPVTDEEVTLEKYTQTLLVYHLKAVIAVNTYLSLQHKIALYSKIEQNYVPQASKTPQKNKKVVQVRYRYKVELPPNYKPNPVELNWKETDWERSGYMQTKWVRPENATLLANRAGGRVVDGVTRGIYQKIEVPIKAGHCYRRKGHPTQPAEQKIYKV